MTGKEFEAWRKKNGWSRAFVAEQLDVGESTIWRWENHDDNVPTLVLKACAALPAFYPITINKGEPPK